MMLSGEEGGVKMNMKLQDTKSQDRINARHGASSEATNVWGWIDWVGLALQSMSFAELENVMSYLSVQQQPALPTSRDDADTDKSYSSVDISATSSAGVVDADQDGTALAFASAKQLVLTAATSTQLVRTSSSVLPRDHRIRSVRRVSVPNLPPYNLPCMWKCSRRCWYLLVFCLFRFWGGVGFSVSSRTLSL